jgi:GT2 family glycosyltransferase
LNPEAVSVVVPTHNRAAQLSRLLRALDQQVMPPREVIVVDDASIDDTYVVLSRWAQSSHLYHTRTVRFGANRGPAAARNAGWRLASSEIVAFTDDDCVPDPAWIREIAAAFLENERIGGVGGRVLPMREDLISQYYTHYRILEPPASGLYLVTANAAFLRQALDKTGGFSEDLRAPGGEDVEVSLRVSRAGWLLSYTDRAAVAHDYRRGLRDFARTFRAYGRGCRRVTERIAQEVSS